MPPRCAGREGWILSRGEQNWFFPFNVVGEDDDDGYDDGDDDNDDDGYDDGDDDNDGDGYDDGDDDNDDDGYDDGDDDNDDDNIKPGEQLFGRCHKWKYKDGKVILDLTHWK